MKPAYLFFTFFFLLTTSCHRNASKAILKNNETMEDGLYRVIRSSAKADHLLPLQRGEQLVPYSHRFLDGNQEQDNFMVLDNQDFVPLKLQSLPTTEDDDAGRKKLLIQLTERASNQLSLFTAAYLNKRVAIVIGGEAVTMHKIRSVIEDGKMQITRCTDNACEYLYLELRDNKQ